MKTSVALATIGVTIAASLAGLTATASAGAVCGSRAPSDIDNSAYPTAGITAGMYNGSSTTCKLVSDLSAGHKADYYCFTENLSSQRTWTYLRDTSSGAQGWVRDDYLPNNGSGIWCGF